MRKITFLLATIVSFLTTTMAQDFPETSTKETPKYYLIQAVRAAKDGAANTFAKYNGDAGQMQIVADPLQDACLFYFLDDDATVGEGVKAVKIGNKATENLCAANNSYTTDGITWYLKAYSPENSNILYPGIAISFNTDDASENSWNDARNDHNSIGYWFGNNVNSTWNFVTLETYLKNSVATYDAWITKYGSYCDQSKKAAYDAAKAALSEASDINSIKTAVDALNVAYNELQATFLSSLSGKKFTLTNYGRLTDNNEEGRYMVFDGNKLTITAANWQKTMLTVWTLSSTDDGKWTLYNNYSKTYIAQAPKQTNSPFLSTANESEAGKFELKASDNEVGENKFCLAFGETASTERPDGNFLHFGSGNGCVVKWNADASTKCSYWVLELVTDEMMKPIMSNTLPDLVVNPDIITGEGNIGFSYVSEEAKTANEHARQLLAGSEATVDERVAAYQALESFGTPFIRANDVSAKYYRIKTYNRNAGRLVWANPAYETSAEGGMSGRGIVYNEPANVKNKVTALWQLEVVDGVRYYIKHVNSGKCFGRITESQQVMLPVDRQYAGKFLFDSYPKTTAGDENVWTMAADVNYGQYVASQNPSEGNVTSWRYQDDPGAGWQFEEVTSVPVSITDALYATLQLPMAVQLPAGLTAYTARVDEANDSRLALTEIADGIVPANTPVILGGQEGTYDLAFTTTDKTVSESENDLRGTNIASKDMTPNGYYGLAKKDGQVGLYLSTLSSITANKAYLPKPAQSNAPAFYFGGSVTGVGGVQTDGRNDEVYYDLNGRRVLYPTKGIYVTAKGQKVFVK